VGICVCGAVRICCRMGVGACVVPSARTIEEETTGRSTRRSEEEYRGAKKTRWQKYEGHPCLEETTRRSVLGGGDDERSTSGMRGREGGEVRRVAVLGHRKRAPQMRRKKVWQAQGTSPHFLWLPKVSHEPNTYPQKCGMPNLRLWRLRQPTKHTLSLLHANSNKGGKKHA
jgi:hypothetical protein